MTPPEPEAPPPPARPEPSRGMRSFTLNSPEFYEAVTEPPDPWLWGPCLPREPRVWEGRVERDTN